MNVSPATRRRRALWPLSWLVVAGLMAAAIAPATTAAADPVWATVTGHAAGGAENNSPDAWGDNCTKLDEENIGSTFLLTQSYDLVVVKAGSEQSATWPNTLFANASAGETVWADSDGSNDFSADDKGISHIIFCGPVETTTTTETTTTETTDTSSTTTETTTTETTTTETTDTTSTETTSTGTETDTSSTTTETTDTTDTTTTETTDTTTTSSSTGQELGVVGTPGVTPPPTDAASVSAPAGSDNGFRMVLLGLAMILAVVLLLQPKGSVLRK